MKGLGCFVLVEGLCMVSDDDSIGRIESVFNSLIRLVILPLEG